MPDDRDVLKKRTPPSGVPALKLFEDEDRTPIDNTGAIAFRLKRAEQRFEEFMVRDERDHGRIFDSLERQDVKLDSHGETMTDLVKQSSTTATHVERLLVVIDADRKAKIRVETAQEVAEIDDEADKKKLRRRFFWKLAIGFVVPIAAAAGIALEHLLIQ
jgi:hypothetical protein